MKTDDVGVFRSTLSHEYLLVAQNFAIGHRELVDTCQNCIDAIFGGEEEKVKLKRLMKVRGGFLLGT